MKKTIILLFALFSVYHIFAQDALHQVKQLAGTEKELSAWFAANDVPEGDLYMVLLPLGNCPRCEGAIAPFFKDVSKLENAAQSLLIAVYSQHNAAQDYLKKKSYGASRNLIINPKDELLNYFVFSSQFVQVPYLMKFNTKRGVLLKADALLGLHYTDEVAVAYIEATNEVLQTEIPMKDRTLEEETETETKNSPLHFSVSLKNFPKIDYEPKLVYDFKKYKINQSEFIISNIMNFAVSENMKHITIDDHLYQ